jgi:hypothetical protein
VNAWLLAIAITVPTGYLSAPVYSRVSENVLKRTGTFLYKPETEGYTVLFCIAQSPVKLRCAVTTPSELMVIIEAQATEQGS